MVWLVASMLLKNLLLAANLASANWRPEEKQNALGPRCDQTGPSELAELAFSTSSCSGKMLLDSYSMLPTTQQHLGKFQTS